MKFENLKYSLKDLFDNQPAFDEPIPLYAQMSDYVPKKLSYPNVKRHDNLDIRPSISEYEKNRVNNLAYEDICRVDRKTDDGTNNSWIHFSDTIFNSVKAKELIEKFDK